MLRIMTRRWISVLVLFVGGLVVTCGVYGLWPPVYEANSIFTMDVQAPKGDYDENSHEMDYYSECYGEVFVRLRPDWRTKEFFSRTIRQFHVRHSNLTVTDKALEEMLENSKLERMGHTRRIKLTVYSQTAELAAALANTYVETVKSFTDEGNKERCVKALTDIHRQVKIMMSVAVGVQRLKRRRSAFDVLPRLATAGGGAELSFAIDCGAKIPFSLTLGRLGSLAVTATEPQIRSGEGMVTTKSR